MLSRDQLLQALCVIVRFQSGMQDHARVPDPVEVAFVRTTAVARKEADVNTIAALGLLDGMHWLMDVLNEVHNRF